MPSGMKLAFLETFLDMSGGLNSDASTYTIKNNESPDLENIRLDPLGPASGRYGTLRKNASGGFTLDKNGAVLSSVHPVRSIFRYYRETGGDLLLFTLDDRLIKCNPTDDLSLPASLENIPPSGGAATDPAFVNAEEIDKAWNFVVMKGWCFFCTQDATVYRTDGNYVYKVGEAPADPAETPTLAAGVGANLPVGDYYYVVTRVYDDGLGESPISTESLVFNLAAPGAIQVTIPNPTARLDADSYNIYRTLARPAASGQNGPPYYLVANIPNPHPPAGALVYNDNIGPTGLGERVDTTRDEPPRAAFCEIHAERLWLGRLSEGAPVSVYRYYESAFSDANKPDQFPGDYSFFFENPKGEMLTGMHSHAGMLFHTTHNYLFTVVGTGEERGPTVNVPDFRVARRIRGPGAMSHRVIHEHEGTVYMMNKRGFWTIQGQQVQRLSKFRVEKFIRENLDDSRANLAVGTLTRNHYRVSFPIVGGTNLPELTMIYDFDANAFLVDNGYQVASYALLDGEGDSYQLFAGEARNFSYLYEMDTGNQDWDPEATPTPAYKNITRRYRTKDFSFGRRPGETTQPRVGLVEGIQTNSHIRLDCWLNKDRLKVFITNLDFLPAGKLWGTFIWNDGTHWGSAGQKTRVFGMPQGTLAERQGFEFTQTLNEPPFSIEMFGIGGGFKGVREASLE